MSGTSFDIAQLDADFHLDALGSRLLMCAPLGVPSWDIKQKRLVVDQVLGRLPAKNYEQVVGSLEDKICRMIGARFCLATGSGREAIKLALLAMGVQAGERIVLPSFCCLSVLLPVLELGLTPVFADSGDDWQVDPASVRRVMRPGDRALIVPHLFGKVADMQRLQEIAHGHGAQVIDDAAQAIGLEGAWGPAGRGGDAGIFSFGLFKPLSAMGGGALVTDNSDLFECVKERASGASPELHNRKALLKIYSKVVWRRHTYRLFLQWRKRQQDAGTTQFSFKKFDDFHRISQLDAHLAASQIKLIEPMNINLQEMAVKFARSLNHVPFLRNTSPDYAGSPRWVVELAPEYETGDFYRQLFAYLIGCGVEVQPTYRPLHHYVRDDGHMPLGEFSRSEKLSRNLMCLPFSAKTNVSFISRCLQQFMYSTPLAAKFDTTRIVER